MITQKSRKKTRVAPGPASDMHPADIKCALEKAGWSLRQLAIKNNLCPTSIAVTLKRRWPRVERIVADTIGLQPWDIWPSRYDENNNPIKFPVGKPSHKNYRAKHSTKDSEKR